MSEREQLLAALQAAASAEEPVVLATVVSAVGSVYRRIGGRMLIRRDGSSVGAVSGGCLEADLIRMAGAMLTGVSAPEIVSFDTRDADDAIWGSGIGCQGLVHVLVEPLSSDHLTLRLPFYRRVLVPTERGVLMTLIRAPLALVERGSQALVTEASVEGEVSTAWEPMIADARADLAGGVSRVRTYPGPDGDWEVCFELLEPPLHLLVIGGGLDAVPVVGFARALGWRVTVVDHRPAFARPARFADGAEVICSEPERLVDHLELASDMRAVVMTHSFPRDLIYLPMLFSAGVQYMGLLGPRRRTEKLLQELEKQGKRYPPELLERIYGPVGLDIGGETPEAIALAVVAEVQAAAAARAGGPLRDRRAPIHAPVLDPQPVPTPIGPTVSA